MQFLKSKSNLLLLFIVFTLQSVLGQENSPYSRYGVGNLKPTENVSNRGMGGVAVADDNPVQANPSNPATYANLKMTC